MASRPAATAIVAGRHAARFAGGAEGVLQGTRTWLLQDADGNIEPTHSVSAGLDYAAVGPEHAWLRALGRAEYTWADDRAALAAFHQLARLEGIMPALESAHAIAHLATLGPQLGPGAVVVVNLSGRGDKDVHTVERLSQEAAMSRLDATFAGLRAARRTGLVAYVTAGDPDLERSAEVVRAVDRGGADVIELGVPFSDPLADGPVIQRATERALAAGATLARVLDMAAGAARHGRRAAGALHLRQPGSADGPRRLRPARRAPPASTASWSSTCRPKKPTRPSAAFRRTALIQFSS